MNEVFVAELLVTRRHPDHDRALAEKAIRWFGSSSVRRLSLEVVESEHGEYDALQYRMHGRFVPDHEPERTRLQRAARWLGVVEPG